MTGPGLCDRGSISVGDAGISLDKHNTKGDGHCCHGLRRTWLSLSAASGPREANSYSIADANVWQIATWDKMGTSDPSVKPGVAPRSMQECLLQAVGHAIRVVRREDDWQPGGSGQRRPDKADGGTAAGQDNAIIVEITTKFRR